MSDLELISKQLCGLAFSIADLMLLQAWAIARNVRMEVRLAHGSEAEEYEEVLAFSEGEGPVCRFIVWRNDEGVFVQPLIGRRGQYASVADMIEALSPKQKTELTDIQATHWPK